MDAETNKCLAALANPTPPEPKSLRSEILTRGSAARNKFCHDCLDAYRHRGSDYLDASGVGKDFTLRETMDVVARRGLDLTPDDLDSICPALETYLDQQEQGECAGRVERLHQVAGKRLSSATLDNYVVSKPEQAKILADVREYVASIGERIAQGIGIVLNGPSGNGKDHLLISAARSAIQVGAVVCWKNGQDLLREFRDRIGTDESEESLLAPLVSADVLVISDPLPPSGSLTDYQASMIYCVLDARYRDCKATWASMNVTSRKEADNRIGVAIVDRLRHEALCLACNWPSYRKPFESGK
jgi:DNA replication protein DnaC